MDFSLAITAFHQIAVMFLIIVVGFICHKIKFIEQDFNRKLSDLVLMLINPLVIFISYQRSYEPKLLTGLLISLVMAVVTHLLAVIIGMLVVPKRRGKADNAIERFAVIYSNCGFIGIPLVNGIFGAEGVFYLTAYMTIFNLVVWTHGIVIMTGKADAKSLGKAVLSPSIIATVTGFIFFMLRINLPDIVKEGFTYLADMNTPLAMLVAGVTIAQTDITKLFIKPRIYYITFFKLLFIPVLMLFIFQMFGIPKLVLLTSVLAAACPTAVTVNLFSIRYEKNYLYASELFAVTTILSVVTIPIVMIIANYIV